MRLALRPMRVREHEHIYEQGEEGREMFQAQRDAIVAAEKQKQAEDAQAILDARTRYLMKQNALKAKVAELHATARSARAGLTESRKQDAANVRSLLEAERQRKLQIEDMTMSEKKSQHDDVYVWKKKNIIGPDKD